MELQDEESGKKVHKDVEKNEVVVRIDKFDVNDGSIIINRFVKSGSNVWIADFIYSAKNKLQQKLSETKNKGTVNSNEIKFDATDAVKSNEINLDTTDAVKSNEINVDTTDAVKSNQIKPDTSNCAPQISSTVIFQQPENLACYKCFRYTFHSAKEQDIQFSCFRSKTCPALLTIGPGIGNYTSGKVSQVFRHNCHQKQLVNEHFAVPVDIIKKDLCDEIDVLPLCDSNLLVKITRDNEQPFLYYNGYKYVQNKGKQYRCLTSQNCEAVLRLNENINKDKGTVLEIGVHICEGQRAINTAKFTAVTLKNYADLCGKNYLKLQSLGKVPNLNPKDSTSIVIYMTLEEETILYYQGYQYFLLKNIYVCEKTTCNAKLVISFSTILAVIIVIEFDKHTCNGKDSILKNSDTEAAISNEGVVKTSNNLHEFSESEYVPITFRRYTEFPLFPEDSSNVIEFRSFKEQVCLYYKGFTYISNSTFSNVCNKSLICKAELRFNEDKTGVYEVGSHVCKKAVQCETKEGTYKISSLPNLSVSILKLTLPNMAHFSSVTASTANSQLTATNLVKSNLQGKFNKVSDNLAQLTETVQGINQINESEFVENLDFDDFIKMEQEDKLECKVGSVILQSEGEECATKLLPFKTTKSESRLTENSEECNVECEFTKISDNLLQSTETLHTGNKIFESCPNMTDSNLEKGIKIEVDETQTTSDQLKEIILCSANQNYGNKTCTDPDLQNTIKIEKNELYARVINDGEHIEPDTIQEEKNNKEILYDNNLDKEFKKVPELDPEDKNTVTIFQGKLIYYKGYTYFYNSKSSCKCSNSSRCNAQLKISTKSVLEIGEHSCLTTNNICDMRSHVTNLIISQIKKTFLVPKSTCEVQNNVAPSIVSECCYSTSGLVQLVKIKIFAPNKINFDLDNEFDKVPDLDPEDEGSVTIFQDKHRGKLIYYRGYAYIYNPGSKHMAFCKCSNLNKCAAGLRICYESASLAEIGIHTCVIKFNSTFISKYDIPQDVVNVIVSKMKKIFLIPYEIQQSLECADNETSVSDFYQNKIATVTSVTPKCDSPKQILSQTSGNTRASLKRKKNINGSSDSNSKKYK